MWTNAGFYEKREKRCLCRVPFCTETVRRKSGRPVMNTKFWCVFGLLLFFVKPITNLHMFSDHVPGKKAHHIFDHIFRDITSLQGHPIGLAQHHAQHLPQRLQQ